MYADTGRGTLTEKLKVDVRDWFCAHVGPNAGILRLLNRRERPYVDAVYEAVEAREYSLRAAVEAIVAHPEFARK